ncbi:MAG: hypothetical protein IKL02_00800 [Kiritimatiellae bacterium]|nr:hypothetical protein [Kiritimatiellia bacterium]
MITAGQFPTVIDWPAQNFQATDKIINDLNIDDPNFSDAYWIGWINYDKLPAAFKLSRYTVDSENERVIVQNATIPENVDVCLVSCAETNTSNENNPYLSLYKNDLWSAFSQIPLGTSYNTYNARLLNKYDPNTTRVDNTYLVLTATFDDTSYGYAIITISHEELVARAFTRDNVTFSGHTGLTPITVTDANLDGTMQTVTVNGVKIDYACSAFGVSGFARPINTSGGVAGYYQPSPAVLLHRDDDTPYLIGGSRFYQQSTSWLNGGYRVSPSTGQLFFGDTTIADATAPDIMLGGYIGTLSLDDIRSTSMTAKMVPATNGNFTVQGVRRSDIAIIRRMYTFDEYCTTMSYQMRYCHSADHTYATDSSKYYPAISDNNEFLGYLLNGETDHDELRPWQIAGTALDVDSNDYKSSDKPQYIPPDPDDRDKIGVSIDFNRTFPTGSATGLFTLYALRQVHVSKLGAKLWATLNDPDQNFWQNLQFAIGAFAETGSADISSVLEYITSIRIYPFALINLPGYTNAGTGAIRLGTGRVALDLGTEGAGNVGIMGQYTGLIDAGSAYIPQHFEDFRDLEDVTISVYLPYIGNIQLNPAEVTGCTIAAEYAVDLTSGSCVAYLLLSGRWGFYPIGIYSGTIGADIPLTASQGNRLFSRQIAATISPILASSSALQTESQNDAPGVNVSSAIAAARTAVQAVQGLTGSSLTPPVLNGGGANFTGFGAPQTAYIQIRRAQYAYTARSFPSATFGNRTAQRATIGSLSGFTRCINPDVSKIPAPAAIQQSIKAKLESGVYI